MPVDWASSSSSTAANFCLGRPSSSTRTTSTSSTFKEIALAVSSRAGSRLGASGSGLYGESERVESIENSLAPKLGLWGGGSGIAQAPAFRCQHSKGAEVEIKSARHSG